MVKERNRAMGRKAGRGYCWLMMHIVALNEDIFKKKNRNTE